MKKITFLLPIFFSILLFSCEDKTLDNKDTNPILQDVSEVVLVTDDIETSFDSYDQLLSFFEGSPEYNVVKRKIAKLQEEMLIIEELNLQNEPDTSAKVVAYLKKINDDANSQLKTGTGNILHFDRNRKGKKIWAPVPQPLMRRKNRNKVSSVTAVTGMVLCAKTWYRGTHYFVWGTKDSLPSKIDNNTESYY